MAGAPRDAGALAAWRTDLLAGTGQPGAKEAYRSCTAEHVLEARAWGWQQVTSLLETHSSNRADGGGARHSRRRKKMCWKCFFETAFKLYANMSWETKGAGAGGAAAPHARGRHRRRQRSSN